MDEDYLLSVSSPLICHSVKSVVKECVGVCVDSHCAEEHQDRSWKQSALISSARRSSPKLLSAYKTSGSIHICMPRLVSRDAEHSCLRRRHRRRRRQWRRPLNKQLYLLVPGEWVCGGGSRWDDVNVLWRHTRSNRHSAHVLLPFCMHHNLR